MSSADTYRRRAAECQRQAAAAALDGVRETLLEIAQKYLNLAANEERSATMPSAPKGPETPSPDARTEVPGGAAKSMPRWPGPYANAGAWKARTTGPSTGGNHTPQPPGSGGAAPAALVTRPTSNGDAARQTSRQISASRRGGRRCIGAPVGRARHDTGKRRGSRHGAVLDVTAGIVPAGYDTEKARLSEPGHLRTRRAGRGAGGWPWCGSGRHGFRSRRARRRSRTRSGPRSSRG